MILTVTLNTALDITYGLPEVVRHGSNRVTVTQQAGGKGVNVARVLTALGRPALVTGLAGGSTGRAVRAELAAAGIAEDLVPLAGEGRRTVAVVESRHGDTTVYLEPGPAVTAGEWQEFAVRYERLLAGAEAVVLSGSLPPTLPEDTYRRLVLTAHRHGVPAVLDTAGPALLAALGAGPALVKPNAAELAAATGTDDPLAGAQALRAAGARAVVASLGPDGLLACAPEGRWRARLPERLSGNPTGAGDSAVAALAAGLVDGTPWPERLRQAAALSAATVAAALAGRFDPAARARLLGLVEVEALAP
ncbi:hexose kinase [Kitasatospora purpeofusca]|uniref:1-phosphofructokinase family hexose kinase n=1 Tax=Kitasatospora purpeofusca TaxID=67352 RepID=UPI002A5AC976|nr:hexose kinase [Kitasatospora purpeofusca]MDY0813072.1 hexose kinase [Kitasatospora purpeofusca]